MNAGTTPPVFVINLDRSPDRLAFVARRLGTLGLPFKRIAAVDGRALSANARAAFAAARPRDGKKGWMDGQIGCFLSHVEAWTQAARRPEQFSVVLEDDLHIADEMPSILRALALNAAAIDILKIEATGQWLKLAAPIAACQGRTIRRVGSAAWGAGAYLISRSCAAGLVAGAVEDHAPVDEFLFNPAVSSVARRLCTYQLVPALCIQDKFDGGDTGATNFGSDIETDVVNQRLPLAGRVRRAITSTLRRKTRVAFR